MKHGAGIVSLFFVVSGACAMAPSYSQFGQDTFVNTHFFKNKRGGIFIDIGASDGVFLSNTYFFERELEWTGICVEPRPDTFEELSKNRDCVCINGCIADTESIQPFLLLKGYTGDLSGLAEHYDPRHIARVNNEIAMHGGSQEVIDVPCFSFNTIVQEYGIDHVDYLSIDTEGSELLILKAINFQDVIVDIIDVENNYGDSSIADFLQEQGYILVERIGCDEIYMRKDYAEPESTTTI